LQRRKALGPLVGGVFLWQISPEMNFVTAIVFGLIGTIGFAFLGWSTASGGGTVSQGVAERLNQEGLQAAFLQDCIKAWDEGGQASDQPK
jgi:hypothetical protein